MQTWPPTTGLPFLTGRYYDSQTLGIYDPIAGIDCFPAGGGDVKGMVLIPFQQWADTPRSFSGLACDVTSTLGAELLMGIYTSDNGLPSRLIHAAPKITVLATGANESTFLSPITLPPGVYWLAFAFNANVEVAGWQGTSGAGPEEGFPTIGNQTADGGSNTIKQFGWEITLIPFGLPQTLNPLPGGAVRNNGYVIPRVCLKVS